MATVTCAKYRSSRRLWTPGADFRARKSGWLVHQPGNGGRVDVEQPGHVSRRLLPAGHHPARFLFCSWLSLLRRPPIRPFCLATSRPARVLSRVIARSNSAKAPSICIIIRPAGVVVSMASVMLRKPAFASSMQSMTCNRSLSDRESRSSFQFLARRGRMEASAGTFWQEMIARLEWRPLVI